MFGPKDVKPPALTLVLSPHLRVAGEAVEGEAQLYFPRLMEEEISEVQIKFRGSLFTYAPTLPAVSRALNTVLCTSDASSATTRTATRAPRTRR